MDLTSSFSGSPFGGTRSSTLDDLHRSKVGRSFAPLRHPSLAPPHGSTLAGSLPPRPDWAGTFGRLSSGGSRGDVGSHHGSGRASHAATGKRVLIATSRSSSIQYDRDSTASLRAPAGSESKSNSSVPAASTSGGEAAKTAAGAGPASGGVRPHTSCHVAGVIACCEVTVLSRRRVERVHGITDISAGSGGSAKSFAGGCLGSDADGTGSGAANACGRRVCWDETPSLSSVGTGMDAYGADFEANSASLPSIPSGVVRRRREVVVASEIAQGHAAVSAAVGTSSSVPGSCVRTHAILPPYTSSGHRTNPLSSGSCNPVVVDASYGRYLRHFLRQRGGSVPHQQASKTIGQLTKETADARATQRRLSLLANALLDSRCVGFSFVQEQFWHRHLVAGLGYRTPSFRLLHANGLLTMAALDLASHDPVDVTLQRIFAGSFACNAHVSTTYVRVLALDNKKVVVIQSIPNAKGHRIPLDQVTKISDVLLSVTTTRDVPLHVVINCTASIIAITFPSSLTAYSIATDRVSIMTEVAAQKSRGAFGFSLFRADGGPGLAGDADDTILTRLGELDSSEARVVFAQFDVLYPEQLWFVRGPFVEHGVETRKEVSTYAGGEGGGDIRTHASPSERSVLTMYSHQMHSGVHVGRALGDRPPADGHSDGHITGSALFPPPMEGTQLGNGSVLHGNSIWHTSTSADFRGGRTDRLDGTSFAPSSVAWQNGAVSEQLERDRRGPAKDPVADSRFRLVYDVGVFHIDGQYGIEVLYKRYSGTRGTVPPPLSVVSISTASLISCFDVSVSGDYVVVGCADGSVGVVVMRMSHARGYATHRVPLCRPRCVAVGAEAATATAAGASHEEDVNVTPATAPARARRVRLHGDVQGPPGVSRYVSWIFASGASDGDKVRGRSVAIPVFSRIHPLDGLFSVVFHNGTLRLFDMALNPLCFSSSSAALSPSASAIPMYCLQLIPGAPDSSGGSGSAPSGGSTKASATAYLAREDISHLSTGGVSSAVKCRDSSSLTKGSRTHGAGGGISVGTGGVGVPVSGTQSSEWSDGSGGAPLGDWLPSPYHASELVDSHASLAHRFRFLRTARVLENRSGRVHRDDDTDLDSSCGSVPSTSGVGSHLRELGNEHVVLQAELAGAAHANTEVLRSEAAGDPLSALQLIDNGTVATGWAAGRGSILSAVDPSRHVRVNGGGGVLHEQAMSSTLARGLGMESTASPAVPGLSASAGVSDSASGPGSLVSSCTRSGLTGAHTKAYADYVALRLRTDIAGSTPGDQLLEEPVSRSGPTPLVVLRQDTAPNHIGQPGGGGTGAKAAGAFNDSASGMDGEGMECEDSEMSGISSQVRGDISSGYQERSLSSLPFALRTSAIFPEHAKSELLVVVMDQGPVVCVKLSLPGRDVCESPFSQEAIFRGWLRSGHLWRAFEVVRAAASIPLFVTWLEQVVRCMHVAHSVRGLAPMHHGSGRRSRLAARRLLRDGDSNYVVPSGDQTMHVLVGGGASVCGAVGSNAGNGMGGYASIGRSASASRTWDELGDLVTEGVHWAGAAAASSAFVAFESLEERARFASVFSNAVRLCASIGALREALFVAHMRGTAWDVAWVIGWTLDSIGDHAMARAMSRISLVVDRSWTGSTEPLGMSIHESGRKGPPGGTQDFLARSKVGWAAQQATPRDGLPGRGASLAQYDTWSLDMCAPGHEAWSLGTGVPGVRGVYHAALSKAQLIIGTCHRACLEEESTGEGEQGIWIPSIRSVPSTVSSLPWALRRRLTVSYVPDRALHTVHNAQYATMYLQQTPQDLIRRPIGTHSMPDVHRRCNRMLAAGTTFRQCASLLSRLLGVKDITVCARALVLSSTMIQAQHVRGTGPSPLQVPITWVMGRNVPDVVTARTMGMWMEVNGFIRGAFLLYSSAKLVPELRRLRSQVHHDYALHETVEKQHLDLPVSQRTVNHASL